jgi:hypothetical protein
MQRVIMYTLVAAGIILAGGFPASGACAAGDIAALAKALPEATVPLQQGLIASEKEGKPISGSTSLREVPCSSPSTR